MSRPRFSAMRRLAVAQFLPSSNPCKALLAAGMLTLLTACGGGGGAGAFGTVDIGGIPDAPGTHYKIGTGTGTGFQEGVIQSSRMTLRAGETTQLRVNIIDGNGEPLLTGTPMLFSSPCTSTGLSTMTGTSEIVPGLYEVIYTNGNCGGTDVVTARLPNNKSATVSLSVSTAQALNVTHVDTTNDQLILKGLGHGPETSEITFRVTAVQNIPIVGTQVTFSVSSSSGGPGDVTIVPGWQSGNTDQLGEVRTVIRSGVAPGPFAVTATHTETGILGRSSDITSSTRIAVANRLSLSYGPWNPAGAFNTDGVEVTINAIVTDMFGHSPLDGTRVGFVSPVSGLIENFCELGDPEPGRCSVTWTSSGPNPPNGRVPILVYMDGAEAFVDLNGNSVYDAGDMLNGIPQFTDLGEPYLDNNQNGLYDFGEFFFDVNNNGVRDPGDGVWNGPCLSAYRPVAVCSPGTSVSIFDEVTIVLSTNTARIIDRGNFPLINPTAPATSAANIQFQQGTTRSYGNLILGDSNGNSLPNGTTVVFSIEGTGVTLQGITSTTIGNSVNPADNILGVTLAAAPVPEATPANTGLCPPNAVPPGGYPADCFPVLPSNVRLLMTVTPPDGPAQIYAWPITVHM